MSVDLLRGFNDPVADAGDAFRTILQAMSRPGSVQPIAPPNEHPKAVSGAAASVLLTLPDHSTPVWLHTPLAETDLADYIRFHSGAALTDDAARAAFAVLPRKAETFSCGRFSPGTDEYPDRSTTVIIDVDGFESGPTVRLSGPGIDGECDFKADGLPPGFWEEMISNGSLFPLGIDVILTAPGFVAAIPRSTKIEVL